MRAECAPLPHTSEAVCGVWAPEAQESGSLRSCSHGQDGAGHLLWLGPQSRFDLLREQGSPHRVGVQAGSREEGAEGGLLRS